MGRLKSCRLRGALALLALMMLSWIVWPLLRPRLWPADGPRWIVVMDGFHRLDAALARQQPSGEPILLITCPATGQPSAVQRQLASAPLLVLREGFDTATQAVALARWLRNRRAEGIPSPRQIVLVSDAHHFPRAALAAQIAVGGSGTEVLPLSARPGMGVAFWRQWPLWRDAARLQLWRITGSTGALLHAPIRQRKIKACFQMP